jgi:hypothetical protein
MAPEAAAAPTTLAALPPASEATAGAAVAAGVTVTAESDRSAVPPDAPVSVIVILTSTAVPLA